MHDFFIYQVAVYGHESSLRERWGWEEGLRGEETDGVGRELLLSGNTFQKSVFNHLMMGGHLILCRARDESNRNVPPFWSLVFLACQSWSISCLFVDIAQQFLFILTSDVTSYPDIYPQTLRLPHWSVTQYVGSLPMSMTTVINPTFI